MLLDEGVVEVGAVGELDVVHLLQQRSGGIAVGEPIDCRVAFKPTATITSLPAGAGLPFGWRTRILAVTMPRGA